MTPEHTKLNLGCGHRKLDDHWNVDINKNCNPDQVLDMEVTPWPYEDNFFSKITATNVLEYTGQDPKVFANIIKEMYRVSADGANWVIQTPYYKSDSYWTDYARVRILSTKTFYLFDQAFNQEIIEKKISESTHAFNLNIDLEVVDVNLNVLPYWKQQVEAGLLGSAELQLKLDTMGNIADYISIFIKVHKPGRFQHLIKNT